MQKKISLMLLVILFFLALFLSGCVDPINDVDSIEEFNEEWLFCESNEECVEVLPIECCPCGQTSINKNFLTEYNIYRNYKLINCPGILCAPCQQLFEFKPSCSNNTCSVIIDCEKNCERYESHSKEYLESIKEYLIDSNCDCLKELFETKLLDEECFLEYSCCGNICLTKEEYENFVPENCDCIIDPPEIAIMWQNPYCVFEENKCVLKVNKAKNCSNLCKYYKEENLFEEEYFLDYWKKECENYFCNYLEEEIIFEKKDISFMFNAGRTVSVYPSGKVVFTTYSEEKVGDAQLVDISQEQLLYFTNVLRRLKNSDCESVEIMDAWTTYTINIDDEQTIIDNAYYTDRGKRCYLSAKEIEIMLDSFFKEEDLNKHLICRKGICYCEDDDKYYSDLDYYKIFCEKIYTNLQCKNDICISTCFEELMQKPKRSGGSYHQKVEICYGLYAKENDDLGVCKNIIEYYKNNAELDSDDYYVDFILSWSDFFSDRCIYFGSRFLNKEELCETITNDNSRYYCYRGLAFANKDFDFCEKTIKPNTETRFQNPHKDCIRDVIKSHINDETFKIEMCENYLEEYDVDTCIRDNPTQISDCQKVDGYNRDYCINNFVKKSRERKHCDLINTETIRERCKRGY